MEKKRVKQIVEVDRNFNEPVVVPTECDISILDTRERVWIGDGRPRRERDITK